jgi:predicted dehydrogenase
MSEKLRAGIVGCGFVTGMKLVPALKEAEDRVTVSGLSDVDEGNARKLAANFPDAKVYKDYRNLLEDRNIDIVYVNTPNASHCEITVAALEAGKHVMCEKPMAPSGKEAEMMVAAAKRTGKKLSVSYQNRYREDSMAIYKACRRGDLGEIYFAKAHAVRRKGVPTWGVFTRQPLGGGPLIDIGTHALDLALWFMNNYEIDSVMGSVFQKLKDHPEGNRYGRWNPAVYEMEDSAFGFIKMKNGATIYLETAWALNTLDEKEASATLCGDKGGAAQNFGPLGPGSFTYSINCAMNDELVTITPSMPSGFYGAPKLKDYMVGAAISETDQWLTSVIENKDPIVLPEQACMVTRILEAVFQSSQTGKAVYF